MTLRLRNGLQFEVRPHTSDRATVNENFIHYPYTHHTAFKIGESDIVVDIGANIGAFTLYAARTAKKGRVASVEPSSENFKQLAHNLKINAIANGNARLSMRPLAAAATA